MRKRSTGSGRENGRHEAPIPAERHASEAIDAGPLGCDPAPVDPVLNAMPGESAFDQLNPRDSAVLSANERPDCLMVDRAGDTR
jgi:hypothetical protein